MEGGTLYNTCGCKSTWPSCADIAMLFCLWSFWSNHEACTFLLPFVKHVWKELEVWRMIKQGQDLSTIDLLHYIAIHASILLLDQLKFLIWGILRQVCALKHDKGPRKRPRHALHAILRDWALIFYNSFSKPLQSLLLCLKLPVFREPLVETPYPRMEYSVCRCELSWFIGYVLSRVCDSWWWRTTARGRGGYRISPLDLFLAQSLGHWRNESLLQNTL